MVEIYLKKVRESKNVSIRKLAEMSGISKNHISQIENGKTNPSIAVLCKLAAALSVPVEQLYRCADGPL